MYSLSLNPFDWPDDCNQEEDDFKFEAGKGFPSNATKPVNPLLARPRPEKKGAGPAGGKWTQEEDNMLREIVQEHGPKSWKKVASLLGSNRTDVQCLHRWNKVLKVGSSTTCLFTPL